MGLAVLALWAPGLAAQSSPARVTLYYFSSELVGYVSVYGSARLVDDPMEKSQRWKAEWEGLYRDREAEYVLIQVVPNRLEVINYSREIGGTPETWAPPSVLFPGQPPTRPPEGSP